MSANADKSRRGLLHFAASRGDTQELVRLLKESAKSAINERDYDMRTPLHAAAANGHVGALEVLCSNGADCALLDRWGRTALADAMNGNFEDAVQFLTKRTTSPRGALLAKQVSFNHIDPRSPLFTLLFACAEGDVKTVTRVLDEGDVDVNDSDDDRRSPAHLAASEGRLDVLKLLHSRKANMNVKDRMGNRPLNDAQRGGFQGCVDFLVSVGAVASNSTRNAVIGLDGGGTKVETPQIAILKHVSKDALKELHERGVREFWSWSSNDLEMEKQSFAKGAGGEVFKCRFRNMTCVAKTLGNLNNPQNLTDLSNEISLMSTIRHPNIVTFFGACFQTPEPVMLLEYCGGGNLESRIIRGYTQDTAKRVKLTDAQKLKYAHQIALAMTFLHRFHVPIIHRDLKPGNVLLTATDDVKVTDFGLAKFVPRGNNKSETTTSNGEAYKMTGETGSYRFMAPEVYEHKPYDRSVDVYAFSMILYWLYSGVRPFSELRNGEEAVKLACKGVRPDLKLIREQQVADICEEGWAMAPDKRPTFSEIADTLEEATIKGMARSRAKSGVFGVGGAPQQRKSIHQAVSSSSSKSQSEQGSTSIPGNGKTDGDQDETRTDQDNKKTDANGNGSEGNDENKFKTMKEKRKSLFKTLFN